MKRDKIRFIAAMFIFGTIGPVRKFIPYSSAFVAFARAFIGVLFLLILHVGKKEDFPVGEIRKNLPLLVVSGVVLGINWILLFEAYRYTSVSVATICYYMAPVIVILVSPFLFGEEITLRKGLASVAAVFGMILVSGVLDTGIHGLTGVLFGLGAAVFYAGVILFNKKIRGLSGEDRTIFQLAFAAIALLPYVLLTEDLGSTEWKIFPVFMLFVAGILHTGIAYALYFGSIGKLPAQTVAIFSYLDPVTAVLLSAFVLREGLSPSAALGVVIVLGSAIFSEAGEGEET